MKNDRLTDIVILIGLFLGIFAFSQAKIDIKIVEHVKFEPVDSKIFGDKVVGIGYIELSTEDEEDIGKEIVFRYPDFGALTNRKNWIKVEKLILEDEGEELLRRKRGKGNYTSNTDLKKVNEKRVIMTKKNQKVKLYAVLDRKTMTRDLPAEIIEGKYVGATPIKVMVYGKGGAND